MTKQLTADEIERMGAAATEIRQIPYPHLLADRSDLRRVWSLACDSAARHIESHSAEWSAALRENERLREALKPFAAICPGGLKDVGGGTLVKPSIKIQLIKNAREALGDSHE